MLSIGILSLGWKSMRMMPDEATPKVEEFEHRSKALDGYSEIDDLMLEVFAFD